MANKPFLMGAEVEYSMSSAEPQSAGRRGQLHRWLLDAIREKYDWLHDLQSPAGIYLGNGSRYYLDSGNHNELY